MEQLTSDEVTQVINSVDNLHTAVNDLRVANEKQTSTLRAAKVKIWIGYVGIVLALIMAWQVHLTQNEFKAQRTISRIAACKSSNEVSAKQAGVWYGILDKFAPVNANTTPEQLADRQQFRVFIKDAYKQLDCSADAVNARYSKK